MTNADRIRQMTEDELAEWLDLHGECNQCAYHPAQCEIECNLIELCGGEDYELARYAEFDADFCPFCGARMDATDTNVGGKGWDDNAESD